MKCLAIISIAFVHDMRIQKVAFIIAKRRQLSYTIQQSMKFSQKQLHDKIRLVEWEAKYPIKRFNLLTIHSLLIDQHPKFIFLKNIVQQYNVQKHPERARSRQPWIERLFQMLSQLIRIPIYQNILHQLEKIYLWATKDPQGSQPSIGDNIDNKVRPTTASTKVRSHSAYSRKTVLRPTSAYMQTIQIQKGGKNIQPLQMNKMNPKVDYSKLKRGQQEFYAGIRSLHSEYEHPKKRLKEYQRKVFYEQQDDSDIEIIEIAQKAPIYDKQLNQQIQQPQIEEVEQLENQQDKDQAQDPNIQIQDNIPFDAQQQVQAAQQQLQQVVDRLKPNVKPYADSKLSDKVGKKYISSAYQQIKMKLQQKVRQAYQDEHLAQLQVKWAQSKGRSKTEVKRRAQSARMLTKIIGVPTENREQLQDQAQNKNLINFQNIQPAQVNKKELRPSTAFTTTNHKNTIYNIKQAIISGNLNRHIHAIEEHNTIESTGFKKIGDRYTIHAEAPKRKDFEEIMKQAQQKVRIQAQNDVHLIKQTLAKNKISLGVNKIAKSISYYENQFINSTSGEDGLKVGITGMGMMKNPFIKIAKKKKKKTKK